mgnify:CR=1 FL=1
MMKVRHFYLKGNVRITQSCREYATTHWREYDAVIGLCENAVPGIEVSYLHLPVKDEDTPDEHHIEAWVDFGVGALSGGRNLLIHCEAGQNRSVIISSLVEALFDKRNWWDIVEMYHDEMLKEDPPANWWPYDHWEKAISEWLLKLVVRPPASPIVPPHFSPISMEEAIKMAGASRPDFLESLYRYSKMLPVPATVVEMGTRLAESTIAIASALKGTGGTLITIDPVFKTGEVWILDAHRRGPGYVNVKVKDVLNRLTALGLDGIVSIVPDYSFNTLARWDGRKISALFCDGEHTYESVLRDCDWMQFVPPGGYAWFDDWISPVERAVMDYIRDHGEWQLIHKSTDAPTDEWCVSILKKDD